MIFLLFLIENKFANPPHNVPGDKMPGAKIWGATQGLVVFTVIFRKVWQIGDGFFPSAGYRRTLPLC